MKLDGDLAKSHFGPDYTLARDVWHLTLWTEQHFGSAQLGPLHFGPSTLWLKTFWLVTFWLLTFGTKWHIGLSRFGLGQFGPVMLWTVTFWTGESWPKTNWTRRHFGPRHFGSRHFGPRTFRPRTFRPKTFRPKTFWPKTFRPLENYIYSTMLYMSRVFIMNNRNNFASSIKCDWRQRSTSKALQEMHRSRDYSKVPTKVGDSGHFRFKPRISAQISHCSYCSP